MTPQTAEVEGVAIMCPPATLSHLRALVQLGVLFSMQTLLCPKPDCDSCQDRMMGMFRALSTVGQDPGAWFQFRWGTGALELAVTDPAAIAEHAPAIGKVITALEKKGVRVHYE